MAGRRRRKSKSLVAQTVELGAAIPQVIALRAARIAAAGVSPSARDRKEFYRMGAEKLLAVNEAWNAMAAQAFLENQKLALSFVQSVWSPWTHPRFSSKAASKRLTRILGKGMAPVRRRTVANAKRLGRTRKK